ncbi:S41 family peptidase [Granulicella arctica]|uniref:S41 family peptidase n=1 Tax=Granulicella arctica TaxID=940613 RepID=UPI0021E0CDFE|nr:S41 family peptidase [Granulicella arctica]
MYLMRFCLAIMLLAPLSAQQSAPPKKLDSFDLQRAHLILRQANDEVRKNYYDTTFHAVDLEKTYQAFDTRLNASQSVNETFRVIAAFLLNLHDSHTFFSPPLRANRSTPGFSLEIIGEKCFVTRIRPGTDAATKLHVGDQVLALNNFKVTPSDFHDMEYFIQVLSPAPSETLDLLSPNGDLRKETVAATLRTGKLITDLQDGGEYWKLVRQGEEDDHLSRSRYLESGDTLVWRMPSFEVDPTDLNRIFSKAQKHKNLIIDLRGNSGGYVDTLKEMLSHFFDHEIKLGDIVSRKESKAEVVKPHAPFYNGNVTVLVDRNSASAAELFARVMQLEKRGKVLGDRSAGAVMEARTFNESVGGDYRTYYGFSITSANILMSDGRSLENSGVTPDQILLPTAADLASARDPVLARAAELNELKLDSAEAGKLFLFEWPTL